MSERTMNGEFVNGGNESPESANAIVAMLGVKWAVSVRLWMRPRAIDSLDLWLSAREKRRVSAVWR